LNIELKMGMFVCDKWGGRMFSESVYVFMWIGMSKMYVEACNESHQESGESLDPRRVASIISRHMARAEWVGDAPFAFDIAFCVRPEVPASAVCVLTCLGQAPCIAMPTLGQHIMPKPCCFPRISLNFVDNFVELLQHSNSTRTSLNSRNRLHTSTNVK